MKKNKTKLIIFIVVVIVSLFSTWFIYSSITARRRQERYDHIVSYSDELTIERNKVADLYEELTEDMNTAETMLVVINTKEKFSIQIEVLDEKLAQYPTEDVEEIHSMNARYLSKLKYLDGLLSKIINESEDEETVMKTIELYNYKKEELNNINEEINDYMENLVI